MSYVSTYYKMKTYRETYSKEVYPIPHPDEWIVPNEVKSAIVVMPSNPKQAGRPRTSRIKSALESSSKSSKSSGSESASKSPRSSGSESSSIRICSRCNQVGHYRRTCKVVLSTIQVEESNVQRTRRPKHCGVCGSNNHNRRTSPSACQQ